MTRKVQTKRKETKKGAYYYIDMVSLIMEGTDSEPEFELEKVHQFENILFDFDVFQLNEAAQDAIKELYNYLKQNSNINITIIGHTDDKGSKAYNKKLSLDRAKSISKYLIKLGLSSNRISLIAHGSSNPISNNTSEIGRQKNRRVEFILQYE